MAHEVVLDLTEAQALIERALDRFCAGEFDAEGAKKILGMFVCLRRSITSGTMRAAKRVEETRLHEKTGHKKAGSLIADILGEPVGQAADLLETARVLEEHPEIDEALRKGKISESQVKEIAHTADSNPDEVQDLLNTAQTMGLGEFKKHCAERRSASDSEADANKRFEKMRKGRFCRTWTDHEGFGHLHARMTPDALAVVRAGLEPFEKKFFDEARASKHHESRQVYTADALVAMAQASLGGSADPGGSPGSAGSAGCAGSKNSRLLVRVRADLDALLRGHATPGEVCEVVSGGPIPPALITSQLRDAIFELVATKGTEVWSVCTSSRHISRILQIALEERDPTCSVPGCDIQYPLERDHWRTDFAKGGETKLDNLLRVCGHHHHLKTHKGWRFEGSPGNFRFVGPDDRSGGDRSGADPPDPDPPGPDRTGADPPAQGKFL